MILRDDIFPAQVDPDFIVRRDNGLAIKILHRGTSNGPKINDQLHPKDQQWD